MALMAPDTLPDDRPLVSVIMGSKSDWETMRHADEMLTRLARLLRGRHLANAAPELNPQLFELGLLAILMHDTGYLKRVDDREGTGA